MMKRKVLILSCALVVASSVSAQVGINIEDPQGIFHFDGKGNTQATGDMTDDIVVTNNGKVGVGTVNPDEDLQVEGKAKNTGDLQTGTLTIDGKGLIKGKTGNVSPGSNTSSLELVGAKTIRIEDPNYSPSKYLTSDGDGNTYWDYLRPDYAIVGMDTVTGVKTLLHNPGSRYQLNSQSTDPFFSYDITDYPLVLTPGKWLILAKFVAWKPGSGSAGTDMLLWTYLRSKPVSEGGTFDSQDVNSKLEVTYGFKPEIEGWRIITPSLSYMVDIPEDTEYRIFARISVNETFSTFDPAQAGSLYNMSNPPDFGGSFFTAIRLDDKYTAE